MDKELEAFREFKKNYKFRQLEVYEVDGVKYCEGISLIDDEGNELGESEKWLNIGFKLKGAYSKVLSNLFPYEFVFRGKSMGSIEAFFQGIKFRDVAMQDMVLRYSGLPSNYIKVASDYNWKDTGIVYWQGKAIDRHSKEYEDLVDELYISAIQNPLYRSVLKKCDKYILHEMGDIDKKDTVFTRYEFERELNCLKDFLKEEK